MADYPPQYTEDDLLNVQLQARERASREDAAIHGLRRSHAAARALGLPLPPAPDLVDRAADQEVFPTAPGPLDEVFDDDAELEVELQRLADSTVDPIDAATASASADNDLAPLSPEPDPSGAGSGGAPAARSFVPPDVQLPRGGPAAVTTGVLAAAAAQKPKVEKPLLELRPNSLATELDRIGDQLVVMTDRIELRDRHGALRRQLAHSDIEDITVERRLTSAVLRVQSRTGNDMVVKGLRPDLAEDAQAAILALLPDVPVINTIEERALMHSIVALHRAGVLNDDELATKTALVARMAGH